MNTKKTIILGLKITILIFLLFVCYSIASIAVGLVDLTQSTDLSNAIINLLLYVLFRPSFLAIQLFAQNGAVGDWS
jgi:hypothetical protein